MCVREPSEGVKVCVCVYARLTEARPQQTAMVPDSPTQPLTYTPISYLKSLSWVITAKFIFSFHYKSYVHICLGDIQRS